MSFRIEIYEVFAAPTIEGAVQNGGHETFKRFEQSVETLDLKKIIDAINSKPRKPRERKAK